MRSRLISILRTQPIALLALFVALGGTSYAAVGTTSRDSAGAIVGCVGDNSGRLRVVSSASRCGSLETPISFNRVGKAGRDGDDGKDGAKGKAGDNGRDGAAGADSTVAGPQGVKGDTGAASTVAGPQGVNGDTGDTGASGTNETAASLMTKL